MQQLDAPALDLSLSPRHARRSLLVASCPLDLILTGLRSQLWLYSHLAVLTSCTHNRMKPANFSLQQQAVHEALYGRRLQLEAAVEVHKRDGPFLHAGRVVAEEPLVGGGGVEVGAGAAARDVHLVARHGLLELLDHPVQTPIFKVAPPMPMPIPLPPRGPTGSAGWLRRPRRWRPRSRGEQMHRPVPVGG
jgi:hypothetical protein